MKRLTLVRHAKSSWKHPELADFDRPLNKRGRRDAPFMAARLAQSGARPGLILTSPALRARLTALPLREALQLAPERLVEEPRLYEADAGRLLEILRGLEAGIEHVLVVAHNPGLTDLVNLLSDAGIDNLPTCGIVSLAADIGRWGQLQPGRAQVLDFDYPKRHAR